jgi:hypothetical protein
MVNMLLRCEGATCEELAQMTGSKIGAIHTAIYNCMMDDMGFDVVAFREPSRPGMSKPRHRYKIVGRWAWSGKYRSFINKTLEGHV